MRARRKAERREALRGRRRLRGDAGDVSAGRRPPRLPQIGRRLDRARRDLAVLPARRPRPRCSRRAAPIEKKDLKVGFIPITCATPIIMAQPMGFYTKHGLNVEVIKTAGWAVIRDKTHQQGIRRGAHAVADADRDHARRRLESDALHDAGGREHQRPGDHARDQAQGQARSEVVEGLQVRGAVRLFDAQLSAALLSRRARPRSRHRRPDPRGAAAGNGREPARRQYRRLPRPRSDEPARGLSTASASSTSCRRTSGKAIRAAPSRRRRNSSRHRRTPTRRCSRRSSTPPRSRPRPRTASRSPRRSRRRTTSTSRSRCSSRS